MNDLFSTVSPGINILDLHWRGRNTSAKYTSTAESFGIRRLMEESEHNFRIVTPDDIGSYDDAYLSVTSVSDVIELIRVYHDKPRPKIHIGGSGCINIRSVSDIIESASFGRCEGIFDRIINGEILDNVWRRSDDPDVRGTYSIRPAQHLLKNESSVGCKYKCKFCQYTHVRNLLGDTYTHGGDLNTPEDNMLDMVITSPGHHTTALDGLSEETRFRVSKPISDEFFRGFVERAIINDFDKVTSIKLFVIVGYPWETQESVIEDAFKLSALLYDISSSCSVGGRVFIQVLITPFSPEPLTPMSMEPANVNLYWREVIYDSVGANLCDTPNLNCYVLPQINSPLTLLKRVCVNRGVPPEIIHSLSNESKMVGVDWGDYMENIMSRYELSSVVAKINADPVCDYLTPGWD